MEFKYFQGPIEDMGDLSREEKSCVFCSSSGRGFELQYATCDALTDDQKKQAFGCASCLKKGRFEFWHDTEIGLLDENGLRHVYRHNKRPPDDFPPMSLIELRKTPQIVTWQQELWLTHCNDFMAYIGTWEPGDFTTNAPDGDGKSLFLSMTEDGLDHLWDSSVRNGEDRPTSWHATYYVFRCLHCGKLRGNWDCD
jgi:uncharacterized protein CbrC (UPF0167 family)